MSHSLHDIHEEYGNVVQVRVSVQCSVGVPGKVVEENTALGVQSSGKALSSFLCRYFVYFCWIVA